MNYLAINTAVGAEILLKGGHYFAFEKKNAAGAMLLPAVRDLLNGAGMTLKDVIVFACVLGPGSFTGIRIGVSTVRALAYALSKPVVSLTYFDILAYNSIAAFRDEPFTAAVDGGGGVAYIKNFDGENRLPFAVKMEDMLKHSHKNIVIDFFFSYDVSGGAEHGLNIIRAARNGKDALASVVEREIARNNFISYNDMMPLYLRRSQPEREAGEV
ncbi:MAG: tRNA (adenosine(37)-N6)-threonylcarbamoyltransferase complex dimerization subunit type 1 TsaB [Firmicutes bacterium]|nr:tRNA (adenosine(37)-N6)-threonylcarbamoyltransferase complex dimerization subunit type 1 TsaB [Bacillota bacterium]